MDQADAQSTGEMSSKDFCAKIQAQFEEELKAGAVIELPSTFGA
jgi:hypothetical protein